MSRTFNTEIISVGTELLLGHVTNTDARDVSESLSELGINVLYHTVVGDNPERLAQCVKIAAGRANLIITTGGLGPTCDDLTKQTVCQTLGVELKLDESEFSGLYDYISYRSKYTENNTQQAMLPENCTVFHNNCGTAPGCAFEKNGVTVIMLPGPPKECRAMLEDSVVPYLKKMTDEVIVSHCVNIFGIGESGVDSIFADEMNAMSNPSMAPYAKECDCLLQITAKADTTETAEAKCRPVMEHVCSRLGDVVYGIDLECLEQAACALLLKKKRSLAIAEGFTGGELMKRLTDLPDGGRVLKGGFVLTGTECSAEYASKMAEQIRRSMEADISVCVGAEEKGQFFAVLATAEETFVKAIDVGNFRTQSFLRRMAGNYAFDMIRRYLSGMEVIA